MQLALSSIWTRVAVSISYDDNHYTSRNMFTNHIFNIYVKTGFDFKYTNNVWYVIKPNQTKQIKYNRKDF